MYQRLYRYKTCQFEAMKLHNPLNYSHISIDEAIVSLQNPPILSDEAIMSLLKFVKR
jgi:hypothetical protein